MARTPVRAPRSWRITCSCAPHPRHEVPHTVPQLIGEGRAPAIEARELLASVDKRQLQAALIALFYGTASS